MFFSLKNQSLFTQIKKELAFHLKNLLPFKEEELLALLEQPRDYDHGHLSLPLFSLSKQVKSSPQNLAQKYSEKLQGQIPEILKESTALSGFINFVFQEKYLQNHLESLIFKQKLIQSQNNKPEYWVIDFASPNVAKHMNIGHLRATIQGQVLVNLARLFGFKVTAINHLGDWGSQFGKLLWAYKKWAHEYDFENQAFPSLVELYVRFHKEAESDEKNLQEARDLFYRLEKGDPELKKLWKYFVELSLKNYEKYWEKLNIKHDLIRGESFYTKFLEDLDDRLKSKDLLKKSDGAEVVFLEDYPPCLIRKRDGASTYAARDLCSLIYRFEQLKATKNIYITGSDQNLHFKQLFLVAGQLRKEWKDHSIHLNFGMYRFKGKGKMSTRQGQVVYLKDILKQSCQRVEDIINERNPQLENKNQIVEQVGVGALIFNDLVNDRIKDVDFEWSKVLDFNGRSGPFVQYSFVRCLSLLKKKEIKELKTFSTILMSKEEKRVIWRLIYFEEALIQSFTNFKPHILARYLLDLSKEFNRLYASEKFLGNEKEADLLLLTKRTLFVLKKGMEILNVPCPQAM